MDGHGVLVEVEAEGSLVRDVGLLGDIEGRRRGSIKLLGDGLVGVEEVLKEVGLQLSAWPRLSLIERQLTEMVR